MECQYLTSIIHRSHYADYIFPKRLSFRSIRKMSDLTLFDEMHCSHFKHFLRIFKCKSIVFYSFDVMLKNWKIVWFAKYQWKKDTKDTHKIHGCKACMWIIFHKYFTLLQLFVLFELLILFLLHLTWLNTRNKMDEKEWLCNQTAQQMMNNEKWKILISHEKLDQAWEPYFFRTNHIPIENVKQQSTS